MHTVHRTQYHIVWITRYRRKILIKRVKDYLKTKLQEIRKYYPDWEYIEIATEGESTSRPKIILEIKLAIRDFVISV